MNQENSQADLLANERQEAPKLPTFLNVLTILTLIWCAFELYSAFSNFIGGKKALEEFDKNAEKLAEAPAWAKKLAGPEVREMMEKSLDNRVPLLIMSLVAIALCAIGAIQMRKLKKQGYLLWLIGELLPYLAISLFIGGVFFKTIFVYLAVFPLLFVLLYTLQRKHLIY